MKRLIFFCLLALAANTLSAQKILYVRANATGSNNGTSWQNAYTMLSDALNAAAKGDQIWVAAGTYKPTGAVPRVSFSLKPGVALYGGFAGTETTLAARNPTTNIVKLSGDLAGDDVAGDFLNKRTDNSVHVVEMADTTASAVATMIDGFTISGGATLTGTASPDLMRRGAGLLSVGRMIIRRCIFTDNYGDTGGGLAVISAKASGTTVENCVFEKNGCLTFAAGAFFRDLTGGSVVKRCSFSDNTTIRGAFYIIGSANMRMDSCQFINNQAGNNPCAGMYTWQTTYTMTNTIFKGNKAIDFAAMYNDGRSGAYPFVINHCRFEDNEAVDPTLASNIATGGAIFNATTTSVIKNSHFINNSGHQGGAVFYSGLSRGFKNTIDSCTFENNKAVAAGASTAATRGGALYAFKANYEVKNSTFKSNNAGTSGAHVHNADSTFSTYNKCMFEGGVAGFGGAIANYTTGNVSVVENCAFMANKANTSGGAASTAFTANATYRNCSFEGNSARFGGGLFVQNTNSRLSVQGSTFTGNSAENSGGGIQISAGIPLLIENSAFLSNTAGTGGAINYSDDTFNIGKMVIRSTLIQSNFATTQGAGINISNTDTELTNCLVVANLNQGAGAGGGIINNASASASPLTLINCTVADNSALIGGGIAQWQDTIGGKATLQLQNTILFGNNMVGADYEVEAGTPTVISKGGNLCGDTSLNRILTKTNDQTEVNPLFVDGLGGNYRLLPASPCINKGVPEGAPTTDIEGKSRVGILDQGCYEYGTVRTYTARGITPLPLKLTPNPVADETMLTIEGSWSGDVQVVIFNRSGLQMQQFSAFTTTGQWRQPLAVQHLPAGIYTVGVFAKDRYWEGRFVKI